MSDEPNHNYNVKAYATRIGLPSVPEPDLKGLKQIAFAHVTTIPFEGFDPFFGLPISLERADLEAKMVHSKRGGYCFEHNGLMLGILRQMGFEVEGYSARVLMGLPRETVSPRTHLFLKVTIDGRDWLMDFGVGSKSLTEPIRFVLDAEQETTHDIRRIVHENGRFYHQAWQGDHWFDVYEFTGERMPFADQKMGNWLTSTAPGGFFKVSTMSTIARPDGIRATYHNGDFTVRRGADVLEERTMGSNDEALSLIRTEFGIELPEGAEIWSPGQSELKKIIPI